MIMVLPDSNLGVSNIFEPVGIVGIFSPVGGHNYKMAAAGGGGAIGKMTATEGRANH